MVRHRTGATVRDRDRHPRRGHAERCVVERGWSLERFVAWVRATIRLQLQPA